MEAVIHSFPDGADGVTPDEPLINVGGVLYGATDSSTGGTGSGGSTVFSLNPATGAEAVVYTFAQSSDGLYPTALTNVGGTFYGTAFEGGLGLGVVFSLNPTTGVEAVLHAFKGSPDGGKPHNGLNYTNGRLYGTTNEGGVNGCLGSGCGIIFTIRP